MFFFQACEEASPPEEVSTAAVTAAFGEAAADAPAGGGLTYEVYVRSFADSDGDGTGDIQGLRSRLDYLASLGVETIWLMPVFPAFGPAGYDVVEFDAITPEYGTIDDLLLLVADAHARDMRVLLDLPLNHVHRDHPWFARASQGDQAYRDMFVYGGEGDRWFPDAQEGNYYAYFGADMPDLDWRSAGVRYGVEAAMDQWLDVVDGFRLDAVLMLVEEGEVVEGSEASHELVAEIQQAHPGKFLMAEASEWEVGKSVSWLDQSDAVLDFPRYEAYLLAAEGGEASELVDVLAAQEGTGDGMSSFLGSHDTDRLATAVPSAAQRRALMVAHLLLPGSPVLYYGEELDLANATSGTGQDYPMRAPMPWSSASQGGFTTGTPWFTPDPGYAEGLNVADQEADPGSMLNLVRALVCVRAASPPAREVLAEGSVLRWQRGDVSITVDVRGDYRVEGGACEVP